MRSAFSLIVAGVCLAGMAACNTQDGVPYSQAEKAPAVEGDHDDHHEHAPGDDGHSHEEGHEHEADSDHASTAE